MIEVVDVFSCTGVLARGLVQGGARVRSGFEIDPIRADHYRRNVSAPCVEGDVFDNLDEVAKYRGIDFALICPPCAGFSSAGKRVAADPRNDLLRRTPELVALLMPRWLLVENVARTFHIGEMQATAERIAALGYITHTALTQLADYGLPQMRQHSFIWASLDGQRLEPPPVTHGERRHSGQLKLGLLPWVPCGAIVERGLPGMKIDVFAKLARRRHVPVRHIALLRRLYPGIEFTARTSGWNGHRAFNTVIVDPERDPLPRVTGSWNRSGDCLILDGPVVRYPVLSEGIKAQDIPEDWSLGPTKEHAWHQIGDAVPVRFGRAVARMLGERAERVA